jgi:uncharacterized protein
MSSNAPKPVQIPRSTRETLASDLRAFGPLGIVAIVIILFGNALLVPLSALLVLLWARLSNTPWNALGYTRPKSWGATILGGVAFGVALKFLLKALVMPLLGAPAINSAYHWLAGNRAAIPWTLWALIAGAGFGEETVFRGWMFERFGRLFGTSPGAKVATVVITSTWFAIAHYTTQGLPGTEQAAIVGLVFGSMFAVTGRLVVLMIAHATFDLTAYALIYWSLESRVAHVLFR